MIKNIKQVMLLSAILMFAVLPMAIQPVRAASGNYWYTIPMDLYDLPDGSENGYYSIYSGYSLEYDGIWRRGFRTITPIPSYSLSVRIRIQVRDKFGNNDPVVVKTHKGSGFTGPYNYQYYDPDNFPTGYFGNWYGYISLAWKGNHVTMLTYTCNYEYEDDVWYHKPVIQCLIPYSPI